MNPEEYEHHVAAVLRSEGWDARVTGGAHDLGVDVLATQVDRRMAVQAKMYGGTSTRVNAEQVMCLYGAAAYADCSEMTLATDGELTAEAQAVAAKLGVVVREVAAVVDEEASPAVATPFGTIWRDHIQPLAGTELQRENGKTMQIVAVDGSGVRRVTTGGTRQRIAIETFRWTIERLLAGDVVLRQEIHEHDPRQVSSGVMLILGTVPGIDTLSVGRSKALRMGPSSAGEGA